MAYNHIQIKDLPYCKPIGKWLKDRYGEVQAEEIWQKTVSQYNAYLPGLPDYGGKKNGHLGISFKLQDKNCSNSPISLL